ncbi:MAG: hypothetical protein WC499_01280 [Patescibacteria group bacterium]
MPIVIKTTDQEITTLIQKLNKLKEEDKDLLISLLSLLKKNEIRILNQDKNLLEILLKNIKEKRQALKNLNEQKLKEILKTEISFLENVK